MRPLKKKGCKVTLRPENNTYYESIEVSFGDRSTVLTLKDIHNYTRLFIGRLIKDIIIDSVNVDLTLPETDIVKISLNWLLRGKRP